MSTAKFLLGKQTPVNRQIIEERMQKPLKEYIQDCIDSVFKLSAKPVTEAKADFINSITRKAKNKIK
ncbi:MAG: hypothetical protein LBL94_01015 [Prevotellaceae bacterium]|jgi:hypothetical protein|nr:hypothetical protein [Prevotellaceae bacterium]